MRHKAMSDYFKDDLISDAGKAPEVWKFESSESACCQWLLQVDFHSSRLALETLRFTFRRYYRSAIFGDRTQLCLLGIGNRLIISSYLIGLLLPSSQVVIIS